MNNDKPRLKRGEDLVDKDNENSSTCSKIKAWRNGAISPTNKCMPQDDLNRLKSLCGTSEGARYEYRADGMRVKKITGLTIEWVGDEYSASGYYDENLNQDLPTVRYFYDGQMPMEEDSTYKENSVSVRDYTQYGLGARGIDYIRNVHHSSGEAVVFPIYDGHGNMVYTLSRGANETFSLGNKRIYGVWGDLRYDGNPNAGPNTQYCANLGHKKDDESGLTYMRARYYEPWTGRFISEDPAMQGINWYVYCENNPINKVDSDGRASALAWFMFFTGVFLALTGLIFMGVAMNYKRMSDNIRAQLAHLYEAVRTGWISGKGLDFRFLERLADEYAKRAETFMSRGRLAIGTGVAMTALAGYMMLVEAAIIDIDLVYLGKGLDIWVTLFGE